MSAIGSVSSGHRRVLLCSLDGVRPDALQIADTPTIDALVRDGAVKWNARTVMPSSTLPCHMSMLRGVDSTRHGITSNFFQPLVRPVPSVIDVAHEHGLKTGFVYNWEQLRDLNAPGSLDVSIMCGDYQSADGDLRVTDASVTALERWDLDFLFVYFGWPDECAHKYSWMSSEYLDSISHADRCLSRIIAQIQKMGRLEETTIIVTSDHGGHDRTHGSDCQEDILIPWISNGRNIKSNYSITGDVRIFDTCTTIAHLLGLEQHPAWDGQVIDEIFL